MRAAIYARTSTDKQSKESPSDQASRCRDFAKRRGWEVVESLVVTEPATSGASRHNRPGLLGLMARIEEFDVLLCRDFSRLARDVGDMSWIRKQLELEGRTAFETETGLEIFNVGAKFKDVMAEEYIADIRRGTRAALEERAAEGFVTGGRAYGYGIEAVEGRERKRRVVRLDQADVVRRIFRLYAEGDGIKAIAKILNAEGVEPPRPRSQKGLPGRSWSPNAIREMLRNDLYRGVEFWGRSRWVKVAKGKRLRRECPRNQWKECRDETWRIVSDDLWERVQTRIAERGGTMRHDGRSKTGKVPQPGPGNAAKHLLAGFLACEECGGAFCSLSRGQFGCSWRKNRGASTCGNRTSVPAAVLEARVLGAIREKVLTPEALAYVVQRAAGLVEERRRGAGSDLQAKRDRLGQVGRDVGMLLEFDSEVGGLDEIAARLRLLKDERGRLERDLATAEATFDPEAVAELLDRAGRDLEGTLAGDPDGARRALRALLDGQRLRVGPDPERGFRVEGTVWLSTPLDVQRPGTTTDSGPPFRLVAGVRFGTLERRPALRWAA